MKIFVNKIPRSWKSSGVTIKSDQLEMSNFSFIEELFVSTSNNFIITIIGKNIIGNGVFSISIYKDLFLIWQEELYFDGISFSKKQVKIEEAAGEQFKIIISRGKRSKGKILINQVSIYQDLKKEVSVKNLLDEDSWYQQQEDEPTFFLDFPLANSKKELLTEESTNSLESTEPQDTKNINIPEIENITKENAIVIPSAEKIKTKKKPRYVKIKSVLPKNMESNIVEEVISKKMPKDIWIMIIDFDTNIDERTIFNYLNQINFGKDKQVFLVKQSSVEPIDFSKYQHVRVFSNDIEIINELELEWPKKITFIKENIKDNLLNEIERIKKEILS